MPLKYRSIPNGQTGGGTGVPIEEIIKEIYVGNGG